MVWTYEVTGCYQIPCGTEGISNKYSQVLKKCMVSMLLIRVLLVIGLHELQVLRKANRSSVMLLALALFWGCRIGDFGSKCYTVKPLTQVCTLKLLKPVRFEETLTSRRCCWDPPTWQCTTTHKFEHAGNNHKTWTDCSSLPTIQARSSCLRMPPLCSSQGCNSQHKVWERWWGYWRSGCEYKIQTVIRRG